MALCKERHLINRNMTGSEDNGSAFFEIQNVSKYFARVIANKDITFFNQPGRSPGSFG